LRRHRAGWPEDPKKVLKGRDKLLSKFQKIGVKEMKRKARSTGERNKKGVQSGTLKYITRCENKESKKQNFKVEIKGVNSGGESICFLINLWECTRVENLLRRMTLKAQHGAAGGVKE